jgi:hypothetical protein
VTVAIRVNGATAEAKAEEDRLLPACLVRRWLA